MRTKAILIAVAAMLGAASAGAWFFISEKQAAHERRQKFFGKKDYPTSGGQKMKPEW
ncbi:entry exclusion protein TrbK [Rhizobium sp. BT-226]|uniref:entry exclusion protein TrbK n=1 Tax=Rhizobium sp. BT-226 TaxID=2986922 RepID=UPI00299D2983|nr:entry exclusion protein TrbK [Rhizobium sp. BT-226]